ncbi:MAG: DNA cytosine methyltransferase [Bacteroidetes bacterium]|nr:DNA cytosine methyltransferase [Bacteroidota bacterium]
MTNEAKELLQPTPILSCSSTYTGAGIVIEGYKKAGFTLTAGFEYEPKYAATADANNKLPDGRSVVNFGRPDIGVDVSQLSGSSVRSFQKRIFGIERSLLFEGGPTCDDFSPLNQTGDFGRRIGMIHQLRLILETEPLVAVIEQSDKFLSHKNKDISDPYFEIVKRMPYRSTYKIINAIHYGSRHSRKRFIHVFIHRCLEKDFVFPEPLASPVIRVKDLAAFGLDIDSFCSGHFVDHYKYKNHVMCAVTGSSPATFTKGERIWTPTVKELMILCNLDPDSFIMLGSETGKRQMLGNLMSPALSYELGQIIRRDIFGYNRKENGVWVPDWIG